MTPDGIAVWVAGLLGPILVGQLRRFAIKVTGKAAVMLAIITSIVLSVLVELFFGGVHLPKDLQDFAVQSAIIFGVATAVYKLIYGSLSEPVKLALVGCFMALFLVACGPFGGGTANASPTVSASSSTTSTPSTSTSASPSEAATPSASASPAASPTPTPKPLPPTGGGQSYYLILAAAGAIFFLMGAFEFIGTWRRNRRNG